MKVYEEELKRSILKRGNDTLIYNVNIPEAGGQPPTYGCLICRKPVRGDYAETHAKEHGFEFWTLSSSARETRSGESK